MRNHVPTVSAVAAAGATLELAGKDGHAPLLIAILEGKFFAAQKLIELGVNPNAKSGPQQLTPLMVLASQLAPQQRTAHMASGPGPADLAELLIKKGADVNAVSVSGVTALMIAAGHNNPPLIGLLAKAGADFTLRNSAGQSAAEVAVISGSEQAAKMLRIMQQRPALPGVR
jgi:ankyrin repeat protein